MRSNSRATSRLLSTAALLAVALSLCHAPVVRADDDDPGESRIRQGFAIAPVPLNLRGRNHALVGMGSYIVNAQGACSDCHTSPTFAAGGNPYLGEPKKINADGYMGGGGAYGPFISRNLTPDKTGMPGGSTFAEFVHTMRTGIDRDRAHPRFGPFLQVMPWPLYADLTDRDLLAIYEYLRAIPCVEGTPGLPAAPSAARCH